MPSIFRGFRRFFQNRKIDAANIENHLICIQLNRENSAKREKLMPRNILSGKTRKIDAREKLMIYSNSYGLRQNRVCLYFIGYGLNSKEKRWVRCGILT